MTTPMQTVAPGTARTAPPQWEKRVPPRNLTDLDGVDRVKAYAATVHDGTLRLFVTVENGAWHLSISHTDEAGNPGRYPTWDEIKDARYRFVPNRVGMVMHLPPREHYVNAHETTFHLYEEGKGRP